MGSPSTVLATAKHWVGDGGTTYDESVTGSGYPIDQGVTRVESEAELFRLHIDPYVPAIEAGVGSVMPSYSAVSVAGGEPLRMHENAHLNNDVLKGDLGFEGFTVSDWEGIDKLPGARTRRRPCDPSTRASTWRWRRTTTTPSLRRSRPRWRTAR
ncbi:glycoside hydrolase family 3 N-terminal domain-containing protein [Oerskovia sp. M15]